MEVPLQLTAWPVSLPVLGRPEGASGHTATWGPSFPLSFHNGQTRQIRIVV